MVKSSSSEQQCAESEIVKDINRRLGLNLVKEKLNLGRGIVVEIDGIDRDRSAICEVYSRIGKLKPAQTDKLAADLLKFELIERQPGLKFQKIIGFCDDDAAKALRNKSWLAGIASIMGVISIVADVPESTKSSIIAAQVRQKMTNV